MWNLEGKTALITGGTKGIGRATVYEFAKLGAKVIFTARDGAEVAALEQELSEAGYIASGMAGDVTNEDDQDKLTDFVFQRSGTLDILVNNAGTNIRKEAHLYEPEEYRKILEVNLIAPFELTRKFFALLKRSTKASVINVASVAGSQDVKSGTPYAMSKAGLIQETRSLASEWAQHNIRVNAVSPWYTTTPLVKEVMDQKERYDKIVERTPMKRFAEPEEMANTIAFLAMNKASFITGQNLQVDGGLSANAL
ncbi:MULTISPECIES: SDR family oxidoreductase [unclassified Leeuwenhoekiella]|uniref:SDR family oxidoreductase n=1 Tax=unclassified Leeuwenhoekiella TaxID=2615029 RepID=UPI000C52CFA7|nr:MULTISPECIES: SDR family oxidoreductase [unclassified Leeuwenhoekiella]MAW96603.1 tropinone reductase [Leeuwenhoekiella sp.]MBA81491.1 tropinone reductase [Leeuwenhoekiella sp.]|tara:strand:- start:18959 stop:19717 length:759 start_codon:yes stop_codon:yes gene_type:complete